ncbi:hypothetical protein GHK50_21020 [Sinorhizobium medicae]|uniref:Capsid assembly protein n=1 Tax=Sinorhizobium medicae TaxID=110321 RepID=A0A6G1WUN4_9HYPH|nr:hypothetical protein [Sinorhizobium medicae]MQW73454.1 hypothetical protein [Sinorhizobium medicae]MQX85549.1 hypothetical protein [Sinorhizobium medicae]
MQIEAAAAVTPEASAEIDPAAAALAEAAATAPVSTEEALRAKAADEAKAEAPARPEWLPEEFESAEDMAKAFAKLKAGKEAETPPEGEEPPVETEEKPPVTVDVKAVSAEWAEKGELSEATYADLAAKGFDKEFVNGFIEGQQARADAVDRRLTEAAGGKDHLDRMFAWASTSMTAAEVNTYNASFAKSDVTAAELAIKDLRSKYEAANGRDGKLLGGKAPAANADTFDSWAEVTKAMSDSRYKSDPAYVAKVQAKLARSNKL